MRVHLIVPAAAAIAIVSVACGGSQPQPQGQQTTAAPSAAAAPANASLDKNAYPVFPDADAGADPSVPAEQGGKGFKGDGWETNSTYELIGDPRAVKGGVLREYVLDFPGTLRVEGPESNTALNYM